MPNQRCQNNNDKIRKPSVSPEISEPSDAQVGVDENISNTTPPEPIAQSVFDRLNAKLQQEHSDTAPDRQQQLLEQLGRQLRQWRIKQGYSRQELADKLSLDVNRLLGIEHGLGMPGDISEIQLRTLFMLLAEDELDRTLRESVQHYFALLKV